MNRNIITVLLIFLVPVCVYWGLTKDKAMAKLPGLDLQGPKIVKFSSPMCYECQELEKIFDEVYPNYASKIILQKVDVTGRDSDTKVLIRKYQVKLVPTCVFIDNKGDVIRQTEGSIQPKILENYMKEIIDE